MKLMVIDGNSIINRAFYGIRPLTTREGIPTNAVYGFVTTLQRLLDDVEAGKIDMILFTTFDWNGIEYIIYWEYYYYKTE